MNNIDLLTSGESLTNFLGMAQGKNPTGSGDSSFFAEIAKALAGLSQNSSEGEENAATKNKKPDFTVYYPYEENNSGAGVSHNMSDIPVEISAQMAAVADLERQIAEFQVMLSALLSGKKTGDKADSPEDEEAKTNMEVALNAELEKELTITQPKNDGEVVKTDDGKTDKKPKYVFIEGKPEKVNKTAETALQERKEQLFTPPPQDVQDIKVTAEQNVNPNDIYAKDVLVKDIPPQQTQQPVADIPDVEVKEVLIKNEMDAVTDLDKQIADFKDMLNTMLAKNIGAEAETKTETENIAQILKTALDDNKQETVRRHDPVNTENKTKTEQKSVFVVKENNRAENNSSSAKTESIELKSEDKQSRVSTEANHTRNEKHEGHEKNQGQDSKDSRQQQQPVQKITAEEVQAHAKRENVRNTTEEQPKSEQFKLVEPPVFTLPQSDNVQIERTVMPEPVRLTNITDMTLEQPSQTQDKSSAQSVERVLKWESVRDAAQLGRIVQQAAQNGETKLTVRLDPAHLGRLEIQLREVSGRVDVRILANSAESRNILATHGETIRQNLLERGIHIDNMDFAFNDTLAKQNQEQYKQNNGANGKKTDGNGGNNGEDNGEEPLSNPKGLYA